MLGEGGLVFFVMPENKMTFITVKVVSSSVHKILENWSYRCADCLLRLHTCMFQPWNDVLCVLSRYRKVSKYWESGSLIGWWSHPLSHRILKRYSVYWASREQSAAAAVWLYALAGAVSLYPVIDKIRTWLITLSSSTHSPARGHFHVPTTPCHDLNESKHFEF